jgi:hypothetical protein
MRCFGLLTLALACAASAQIAMFALQVDREPGLQIFTFQTDDGSIRVYLPDEIHTGDEITGSAEVVHSLSSAIRGYQVDFAGGVSKIGPFERKLVGGGDATFRLRNPAGKMVAAAVVTIGGETGGRRSDVSEAFPWCAQEGGTAIVPRRWPGDALARGAGFAVIRVPANGIDASTRLLRVELDGIPSSLGNGKRIAVTLRVEGLKGIDREVPIRIENKAPSITRLFEPREQLIWIRPRDVDRQGRYTRKLQLSGIQAGEIRIAARLAVPRNRAEEVSLVLQSSDPSAMALRQLPYDAFPLLVSLLEGDLGFDAVVRLFDLDAGRAMLPALQSKNGNVSGFALRRFLEGWVKGSRTYFPEAHAAAVRMLAQGMPIEAIETVGITGDAADFPLLEKCTAPASNGEERVFTAVAALARLGSKPHLERLQLELKTAGTGDFQQALRLSRILEAAGFAGHPELVDFICPYVWVNDVNVGDMIASPALAASMALAATVEGRLPSIILPNAARIEHWRTFCGQARLR